jgi:hypothetical protein
MRRRTVIFGLLAVAARAARAQSRAEKLTGLPSFIPRTQRILLTETSGSQRLARFSMASVAWDMSRGRIS